MGYPVSDPPVSGCVMGKSPTPEHPIRLLLRELRESGYYHLNATVIEVRPAHDPDGPFGRLRNAEVHAGLYVNDLEISSQGSDDDRASERGRNLYAWEIHYRPHCVEQADAERMLRTFKVLERKMAAMDTKHGRPVTYGQYLGRVALALGAEGFVMRKGKAKSAWESYDDADYSWWSLKDGIAEADWLVEKWVKEEGPA